MSDALNVDAWKLYCEIYLEMFGRPMRDDYAVSPAAIMVLGNRLRKLAVCPECGDIETSASKLCGREDCPSAAVESRSASKEP